jgi:hypothetical protein
MTPQSSPINAKQVSSHNSSSCSNSNCEITIYISPFMLPSPIFPIGNKKKISSLELE